MERYHMFKLGLAILFYAAYCIRPMLVSGLRSSSLITNQTLRPEDYNVFYQGVDGTPGVDFPVLSFIPRTTFSCSGIESGYYADLDTDCQVFHICEEGKKISFLCPNGTIFEQADLICEWWYKVNCTNAPSLYQESAEFLREDLARRKASRRIALDGRERNHGAVMRIEESASVSAQQNGKPLRISSSRGQGVEYTRSTSSPSRSNLIQSAIGRDQNIPQKRYNDADTGNFINNDNRVDGGFEYSGPSSVSVEKQLYTRSTTPSSASNLGEIPSRKQLNKNRGSIKYGINGFGSKITSTIGSTLKPTTDAYDLAFPTHRSEVTFNDFRPRPTSGSNTVKIDSSKVNLGQPKQKGTVALTRNGILNRRLEPTDSDELQVPQETAAFSSNSYNSLQSNTRKFTSSPYPNHRPTYSDLKRPDFSSTKLVNPINSVTPQYITTQSITSGKPFVGSTVGGNVFRGTGRTKQNEATFKPFSATERTPTVSTYQPYEGSKLGFSTGGAKENKDAIKPFPTIEGTPTVSTDDTFESSKLGFSTPQAGLAVTQQNQEGSGSISSTERGVLYTVKPFTSSHLHISDDNNLDSTTPQDETSKTQEKQESFGPSDGTVPYTVQPVFTATYNTDSNNQAITSTSQDHVSTTQQNEETDGPYSTTDRAVPYTVQPVVSSTYQSFQDNSQGFSSTPQPVVSSTYQYFQDNSLGVSSTPQPGLSSTSTPSVEGKTTRPVDHATVYGSFSRGPTTATPPNGVEVKLGKNADKISIQLSKSFGGQPPKHGSTVGPQLASDGFVRITAGLSQPVVGGASQANLRGFGRGTSPPLYSQSGKGITASAAGSGGAGIAASTVLPNTLSLSEGTTLNVDIPESTAKGASTLIPSHVAPEIRVNNVQSTTETPGAIETQTGAAENLNTGVTIAENDIGIGNTASGSPVKFNIDLATGSTGKYFNNGNIGSVGKTTPIFSGTGSTDAPNVQISIGSRLSGSTTAQPSYDNTGSTLLTNVEGSTLVPGSLGYDINSESQPTNGGLRTPTSSIVSTRISDNALRGLVSGASGITAIPNIAIGEDSNGYPSSSVRPNVYAESQPTNGGLRTPTSSIVSTRISGNALRGLVTGAPAITAIPNIATGEDSNTGYPSSSVSPNVYAESQPTNGGLKIPTSNIVSTSISGKVIEGLVAGASGITAIPNIALSNSTGGDSNTGYPSSSVRPNVYISEKSKNTVSLPVGSGYDYSTVSSVTNGAHSQVTELLPIPETPRGSLQTINGTNSHSNSFRPNFYPTREGGNNVGKPTGSQVSTVEGNSYQSPPNSIKTFASDIQGTVPSSLRTQSVEINLSQNDIGSTLSPTEESSTYRSTSTQQSNDYNSFKSSSRPGESDVTGTGFYVTRNSFTSTTPAPFGLSQATTSSYSDSTPLVNVSPNSGEEVTPRAPALDTLSRSETRYPRPFQKSPNSIDDESSATKFDAVTPTYFSYKISSARPFELPKDKVTPSPTIPTPFTTARSVQENVDDMINTLKEVIETQDYSSETPRPGLVVPPSAGPQTLHTLAQYFANALDGIVAEREKETGEELDPESKEKLTSLLTQMTMYRYNELFNRTGIGANEGESTTATPIEEELEEGDSNNLVETPELRDLAKNFSLALAGYLNDPVAFRNELKTFRPTEPTTQSDEISEIGVGDEELLNFSDADSKTSFKPSFPTPQAPAPTWGYIVAPKSSEDLDVKNSLNPDLHTADSQSFVPGFNNLAANTGKSIDKGVGSQRDVPGDHWTASPGVTKLWQSALSVNPSILNENLDSTRPISHFTEPYVPGTTPTPLHFPQSEIQYDLRALPKLTLNSTQVHGILIDFVNTTKPDDSNRLQRLLKKLNTTEDEFLHRMKEIESNPLTKRLILLLISECGANVTKDLEADPIHSLSELLNSPSSDPEVVGHQESRNSDIPELVDPSLQQDDQDTRALQLLNSLYAIASKFGK
ncbi:mucin-5AC-like [Anoplophora glabripennis]|uniref:mucin-5AC-like n=1 Tax=Anoplophora glabripennis TaxID=217634 RepID=UPI000C75B32B|nr:mucin-5AC-like [Anoplophora glabripennis]